MGYNGAIFVRTINRPKHETMRWKVYQSAWTIPAGTRDLQQGVWRSKTSDFTGTVPLEDNKR